VLPRRLRGSPGRSTSDLSLEELGERYVALFKELEAEKKWWATSSRPPPDDEPEVDEVVFEPTADVTLRDLFEDELEELLGWRLL
jgi:hypothetical protein